MSECPPRDRKIVFIPSESDEKTSIFNDFQRHEVQPIYRNILDPICLHPKVISYWVIHGHISPISDIIAISLYRFGSLVTHEIRPEANGCAARFCGCASLVRDDSDKSLSQWVRIVVARRAESGVDPRVGPESSKVP